MKKLFFFFLGIILSSFLSIGQRVVVVDSYGNGDYTTISMAIADPQGILNDLVIKVKSGYYSEQLIIDSINISENRPNSIQIIPHETNTQPVIVNASAYVNGIVNYVLNIKNSTNVTITGITFENSNPTFGRIIEITGFWNENITFNNCIFSSSTSYVEFDKTVFYVNSDNYSYLTIRNCILNNGSYGIFFEQTVSSGNNTVLENNTISNFGAYGIYAVNYNNIRIQNNHLFGSPQSTELYGIYLSNCFGDSKILNNTIYLPATMGSYGLYALNFVSGYLYLVNNMITVMGTNYANALKLFDTPLKMFYNTLLVNGGEATSFMIEIDNPTNNQNNTIINNIISSTGSFSKVYNLNALGNYEFNYNIYSFTNSIFAEFGGSYTFMDWQTQSYDLNSFIADPIFNSFQDLHIINKPLIFGTGIDIEPAIETSDLDIDNQVRANPPCIGADEVVNMMSSTIDSDTTWQGIVYIEEAILINNGVTLTIMPGTQVIFTSGDSIACYGIIQTSNQNFEQPISFFSSNPEIPWSGIKLYTGSSEFYNCNFHNTNQSALSLNYASYTKFERCGFENNHDNNYNGSAISIKNSSDVLINACKFNNNHSQSGTISQTMNAYSIITNCIFTFNSSMNGGDISITQSSQTNYSFIENNTFFGSFANTGKSIYTANSNVKIFNNIFWGYQDVSNILSDPSSMSNIEIFNNTVQGGEASFNYAFTPNSFNVFYDEPRFVDVLNFDFHLQPNSPCIDKGQMPIFAFYDFEGHPRPFAQSSADLGAFEFQNFTLNANAGIDISICDDKFYLAANTSNFTGTWSVASSNGNPVFTDINNPLTLVKNLAIGDNFILKCLTARIIRLRKKARRGKKRSLFHLRLSKPSTRLTSVRINNLLELMELVDIV